MSTFYFHQAGHVYIVDYKELEGIKRSGEEGDSKFRGYAAEPICLFYVKSSGDLVPIAIQLFQQPSDTNPIWTPNDSQYDWLLAKIWRCGFVMPITKYIRLLEITSPPNTSLVSIGLFVSKLPISFQPSPNTFSILL